MRGVARILVLGLALLSVAACGSDKGGGGTGTGLGGIGGGAGGGGAGGAAAGGASVHGSCTFTANSFCIDYTGAGFQEAAQPAATSCQQQGGAPAKTACATAAIVGTCVVNKGQNNEMVLRAYAPLTREQVQGECQNIQGEVVGLVYGQ